MLVNSITPFNSAIFSEYIFPHVRELARDPDPSVRCILAQCMVPLATTAQQYLEMGQALKMHASYLMTTSVVPKENAQVSFILRSFSLSLDTISLIVFVWSWRWRPAASRTRSPFCTSHGPIGRRQACSTSWCLISMYLLRPSKNQRCTSQSYDHLSQWSRLAFEVCVLWKCDRCCSVSWWEKFGGVYFTADDAGAIRLIAYSHSFSPFCIIDMIHYLPRHRGERRKSSPLVTYGFVWVRSN